MMGEVASFNILVDRSELDRPFFIPAEDFQLDAVVPFDQSHFADTQTARFVEPISLIAAVSVSVLAYRLIEHWLTGREHGVQIDARTTPATITNIAGIPAGFVVIIAADGKVTTQGPNTLTSAGLADLLGAAAKPK